VKILKTMLLYIVIVTVVIVCLFIWEARTATREKETKGHIEIRGKETKSYIDSTIIK